VSRQKTPAVPVWYKNTYFWISGALLILGVVALIFGDHAIRDPGQKFEEHLWLFYFIAAIAMLANGVMSHLQTVQLYKEETQGKS